MSAQTFVVVDDTDASIAYSGMWQAQQSNGGDYMGTIHHTTTRTARAVFTFNGTSVEVYGTLPPSRPPSSNYTLDDREPVTFVSHNVSSPAFQQQLYASPPLSDGPHILTIQPTLEGPNFYIDFFQYIPGSSSTSASSSPSASPSGFQKSGSNAGKIAGGVVGGVAALAILSALFLWRRRRTNHGRAVLMAIDTAPFPMAQRHSTDATPTPFLRPPPTSTSSSTASAGKLRHYPSTSEITASVPITASAPSQPGTSTSAGSSMELEPLRHRDGGTVPFTFQRVELPPAYEDRMENPV